MNNDVLVSVLGIQKEISAVQTDEIETITVGKYYNKGDKIYIVYKEEELSKEETTTSTIKIHDEVVTLSRLGGNNTFMVFEAGKKNMTHYKTPYGTFELGIVTRQIDIDFKDDIGEITIVYLLEVNNAPVGVNTIRIRVQNNDKQLKLI